MTVLRAIGSAIRPRWRLWLLLTVGFAVSYYAALMLSLVVRFGNWPNYMIGYDWFGNVAEILRATPSWRDVLAISADEWLLEIGYMNYDYGHGISEWSLNILPLKTLTVLLLGALIATNIVLLRRPQSGACRMPKAGALAGTGFGGLLVAMTSATMFWVVCCASPSWVVGLAMLGVVSVPVAFLLEPLEHWLTAAGFALLIYTAIKLAQAPSTAAVTAKRPLGTPANA